MRLLVGTRHNRVISTTKPTCSLPCPRGPSIGKLVAVTGPLEHSCGSHSRACVSIMTVYYHDTQGGQKHELCEELSEVIPMHMDITPKRQSLPRRDISCKRVATQRAPAIQFSYIHKRILYSNPYRHTLHHINQ